MVGRRRVVALFTTLITILALLGAPAAEARKHPHGRAGRTRRCHADKQCHGGTCNDAGQCCAAPAEACGTGCCDPAVGECCNGACVATWTDNNSCGGCDSHCIGGTECQDGVCACPNGEAICNDQCVDLLLDDTSCGSCGHACDAGQACFLGTCGCADTTKLFCNGQCIDGFTDPNNCGRCGNVCPAGQSCVGGACQAPCSPCEELVNNVCVPKDSGDSVCCEWNGAAHYCATGEQCAGVGCCSGDAVVCANANGNDQCCSGSLVCQNGRCCNPDPYPQCYGTGCCWWPS